MVWFLLYFNKNNVMENKFESLSLQDIVALEKMISTVCKKYENIAQMLKTYTLETDNYLKATNSLTYFNNKREEVLAEMERRINEIL